MTTFEDKAEETPEVSLARQSAPGAYRIESEKLVAADDISDEGEFPEFGEFLECLNPQAQTEYVECPQGLAQELVADGLNVGDYVRLKTVRKVDGNWEYSIEQIDVEDIPEERFDLDEE